MNLLKSKRSIGMILLGLWLVLSGLFALLNLAVPGSGMLMAVLALAAGICILLGR